MILAEEQQKMRQRWEQRERERRSREELRPVPTGNLRQRPEPASPVRYKRGHVLYAINVLPRDGKRYKFGWTSNIENRLTSHRVVAPDCILVRTFPCHAKNEEYALACIRNMPGVEIVSGEVFDLGDSRDCMERIRSLFSARDMKKPNHPIKISTGTASTCNVGQITSAAHAVHS